MKPIFTLVFIFFCSALCVAQHDNKIIIGTIDSINSKILNEQRKIWVHVPNGAKAGQRYPVIYLLDGDAHFYSVGGMVHQLSAVNGNSLCPEMIIIGITNTNRTRDLTPTHNGNAKFMSPEMAKVSGGGENFTAFIEKELMPYIDATYPTTPYRVLVGHSLGGLMVVNTLIHHTQLFNAYIAIDPSMFWDDKKLLNQTREALAKQDFTGRALYLAAANTQPEGMDINNVAKDTTPNTMHIRAIVELNDVLKARGLKGGKYNYKYYNDDDHGSVPLIAQYDALRFIFDFYRLKLTPDDFSKLDMAVVKRIEKHYEQMGKHLGYKVMVPDGMANSLGYQAMGMKHYTEAEYLFKMNTVNYPENSNVYDSLGDLYKEKGNKVKAIELYKKALTLAEVADTRKKLNELLKK
ncbi:alpha/beta hydrolase-fold protein [Flavobacterium subsaxonicum]|uniref:Uncharacterized protein n=1 Tax=Flavobacterium subsaxonicum WB 4.1-42 = DSM 21790 TaxID=1121898 RepID=A0A0A2MNT5_9FLAO|nr:alpha/beta hydrolase-fold protein [Flavobacterium subsaxonicum]KGO93196.1 hypothetical protein Q766_07765 [Flavobacterium subsaxonicum WB 4.1-42 = DSM 21790]